MSPPASVAKTKSLSPARETVLEFSNARVSRDFYIDDEQRRALKIARDFWQARHFNFLRARRIREIYTSLGALHTTVIYQFCAERILQK